MKAATGNRHGHRDTTMILVAYRHGLRVSELVDLRWDQIEFNRHPPRPQGQARHPEYPSDRRRRAASAAAAPTRSRRQVAIRVHLRAWSTLQHRRLCSNDRTGQASRRSSDSNRTLTCSDMRAATRWRTEVTTPEHCRRTLDTKTFSTQFDILSYRRIGSKISGGNERERCAREAGCDPASGRPCQVRDSADY